MLSACATSPTEIKPAPDPVIEQTVKRDVECPGEVTAPLPPAPVPPADAQVTGNASGMGWLSAMLAYVKLLGARISDASNACAAEGKPHG